MAATVEGAGVLVVIVYAYRRPVHICEIDVFSQSNVDTEITVVGYVCHSLQSLGGGHGVVALSVVGISLVLIQRDVVELACHGGDAGGEFAFLGAVCPQLGYCVAGHHVRLPAGDGGAVLGVFALLHLYPALLQALHYCTFSISALGIGTELEALHLVECIVRGRHAHLCQLVGEAQGDVGLVVSRARTAQQVGKAAGLLVAEVEGAVRGGVPGADGVGLVPVAPVQGCFGFGGAVVLHGVGADLSLAVYLYGELVARIERAAVAVPVLADARRRCAPRLRLAALHTEGDAGYLQRVLSFGQTVTVRQFVLRAGSRGKEQRGCGEKYPDGMSFLHIVMFFICFRFVLPPPAKAAVAPYCLWAAPA